MASGFSSRVPNTADAGSPATRASMPSRRDAAAFHVRMLPLPSIETTPVARRSSTVST